MVSVFETAGNLSALLQDSTEDYVYKATVANAVLAGTKISVVVRDKPGNTTLKEKVL